jgi:hypothetical protein
MQSRLPLVVLVLAAALDGGLAPGLRAAVAPGSGAEAARVAAEGAQQPAPADELDALRRALAQPGGGEARREREAAVDALLRRREPQAHELLAAVIRRGEDADATASYVLRSLDRIVAQPAGTVFADPPTREIALRIYLRALVVLFADDPALLEPAASAPLRPLARRVLARLTFLDRRDRFEELVGAAADPALARATLRAAGAARDVNLIDWIAARLDDPELAPAARAALRELTFAEQSFTDRASFDLWFQPQRDLEYIELAERAARRGADLVAREQAEADERLVAQTVKLIDALARAEAPDWKTISLELAAAPSVAGTVAYLTVLRDALAARIETGGKLGGTVQDRQAFAREIRLRLDELADRPAAYAIHLETLAYLAVREDAAQRAAVEERLIASLAMAEPGVRRAACRGLRRYPSVPNRVAVVEAASLALAERDGETLGEALVCLGAPAWAAPAAGEPDRESWLLLLREVLAGTGLDVRLRERALDIAVMRASGDELVDPAFDLLIGLVRGAEVDPALRKQALPRLLAFTRDSRHAETYVSTLFDLLADADSGLRRAAAHQLGSLPAATQSRRLVWLTTAVERASARLGEETDEATARELLDALLSASEVPDLGAKVLDGLLALAAEFAGTAAAASDAAFRRDLVVEGLRVLGVSRARDTAGWLRAAEALVDLDARPALRSLLERKTVRGPGDLEDLPEANRPEALARAHRLTIAAARLKPAGESWSERAAEADEVRLAFDGLDKLGQSATDPADRALRVTVLAALGRPAEVVGAGNAALADLDAPLGSEERIVVLRAMVQAQLELSTLDAAAARLAELEALVAGPGAVADLWTRLAQRRLAAGQAAPVVEIMTRVIAATAETDPAWGERFLLFAEARLAADPAANRRLVLEELLRAEGRFAADKVAPAVAARFAELLGRARGTG